MVERTVDAELVSSDEHPRKQEGITLIVGSPMADDTFGQLESHLLSKNPGRFIVIDAPGNVMGKLPYRMDSDTYNISFTNSPDINLIIPREDLLDRLQEKEFIRLQQYYDSLKQSSGYTQHGMMSVTDYGKLTFGKKEGVTKVYHTFPVEFMPVFVNGASLQRGHGSLPLGSVATLSIGNDIRIVYADNTK